MTPFAPLAWRPQWYSLINSIFCHINFAGSVIPNLIDDGVVFNVLKLLCCTVHESDRMQVPWQRKLKGSRCSMEHTEAWEKFLQDLSALRWVSPTASKECFRGVIYATAVLGLCQKAWASTKLRLKQLKIAVQRKMSTFLSTPSSPGCTGHERLKTLKPLELLHAWEHQGREERVWLRAAVAQPLCRFPWYQASWGRGHLCP